MNRADLEWVLKAVLPHVGRTGVMVNVGLATKGGYLYAFATDDYTAGVARIPHDGQLQAFLPAKEATDLMRFVRPTRVAEHEQQVVYAQRPQELHVGFGDESAVFESVESFAGLGLVLDFIRRLDEQPMEFDQCIYQPKLLERFAKAQRAEGDRLRILPRHTSDVYGAAVVTVGSDFIGAIAGMTYDSSEGFATVADFLSERNEAA